jgi:hypothetical protein
VRRIACRDFLQLFAYGRYAGNEFGYFDDADRHHQPSIRRRVPFSEAVFAPRLPNDV